jgi:hypothetical protein
MRAPHSFPTASHVSSGERGDRLPRQTPRSSAGESARRTRLFLKGFTRVQDLPLHYEMAASVTCGSNLLPGSRTDASFTCYCADLRPTGAFVFLGVVLSSGAWWTSDGRPLFPSHLDH